MLLPIWGARSVANSRFGLGVDVDVVECGGDDFKSGMLVVDDIDV